MDFNGWEKLSLVDFDNNVTTALFSGGCNLRCPFCHNSLLVLHPNEGEKIPWDTILEYLDKRKGILDAVAITGGEPTLMPDLVDKMKDIKERGYKIKLDSNGTNPKVLKDLVSFELVDYIAMDIKNSLGKYGVTSGSPMMDTSKIEESISFLIEGNVDYEFRTTLIDEFHTENDMVRIGEMLKGAKRLYLQHYIDSENCIHRGFHEVSKEKAISFREILKNYISDVELRGYK